MSEDESERMPIRERVERPEETDCRVSGEILSRGAISLE